MVRASSFFAFFLLSRFCLGGFLSAWRPLVYITLRRRGGVLVSLPFGSQPVSRILGLYSQMRGTPLPSSLTPLVPTSIPSPYKEG